MPDPATTPPQRPPQRPPLEEMLARAEKAHPAPWRAEEADGYITGRILDTSDRDVGGTFAMSTATAHFIAAARADLPAAARYALWLEEERREMERELESLRDWRNIVTHAPGEAKDYAVDMLRLSEQVEPIVECWRLRVAELEAENRGLREAVALYAHPATWDDGGEAAREALFGSTKEPA